MRRIRRMRSRRSCVDLPTLYLGLPADVRFEDAGNKRIKVIIYPPAREEDRSLPYPLVRYEIRRNPGGSDTIDFEGLEQTMPPIKTFIEEDVERREYIYTIRAIYHISGREYTSESLTVYADFSEWTYDRYGCAYTWRMKYKGFSFTYEVRGTLFTNRDIKEIINEDGDTCWQYVHYVTYRWYVHIREQINKAYSEISNEDYVGTTGDDPYVQHNSIEVQYGLDGDSLRDGSKGKLEPDVIYVDYTIVKDMYTGKDFNPLAPGYNNKDWFNRLAAIPLDDAEKGVWYS